MLPAEIVAPRMPRGFRISDPMRLGLSMRRAGLAPLRLRACLIRMPITPKIVLTMKHTGKPRVEHSWKSFANKYHDTTLQQY